MATATQTDDELIIVEDDAPTASTEEVIDFNETETADTIVEEAATPTPPRKLNLGSLFGGSKKEEAEVKEEVEDSQEIVNLGESLETTSEASDLFNEDPEETLEETSVETGELLLEQNSSEEESSESELSLETDATENSVDLFGETAQAEEVALVEESDESEVSLISDEVDEEVSENSELDLLNDVEESLDLFGETAQAEEVALVEEVTSEDDSSFFGGDDGSTGDDSAARDDTAIGDDESMNTILAATIAKLEARKSVIMKDKDSNKAQITDRKAQIKELQKEIKEFEETTTELTAEQTKITNNVKKLNTMKSSEEAKA